MTKPHATLREWKQVGNCLIGNVYGHPKLPDGAGIRTSTIVKWIDDNTVETQNTIYKLENEEN